VLLSATMPADVREVSKNFMFDFYVGVEKDEWKLETLCDLYESVTIAQAVIFCNTRTNFDWLVKSRDFTVSAMVRLTFHLCPARRHVLGGARDGYEGVPTGILQNPRFY
jgi:superfamily II DNA/RNA helicase